MIIDSVSISGYVIFTKNRMQISKYRSGGIDVWYEVNLVRTHKLLEMKAN